MFVCVFSRGIKAKTEIRLWEFLLFPSTWKLCICICVKNRFKKNTIRFATCELVRWLFLLVFPVLGALETTKDLYSFVGVIKEKEKGVPYFSSMEKFTWSCIASFLIILISANWFVYPINEHIRRTSWKHVI